MSEQPKNSDGVVSAPIRIIERLPARLFAIGDVHGCALELEGLVNHLEAQEKLSSDDLLVFSGDYIDRGPGSRQVIELLLDIKSRYPETVFLKGNHEDMLLSFLGYEGYNGEAYLQNGGKSFFDSYSIKTTSTISQMRQSLPEEHINFLTTLEIGASLAEFIFVHAGIRPEKKLMHQDPHDLMWIRSEFTTLPHTLEKTVVFGHTPYEDIFLDLPYKIGIDTGLVYGNMLSCLELVEGKAYQVDFGETDVNVTSVTDRIVTPEDD